MELQKEQSAGEERYQHPKHGIVRIAFTPNTDHEATVIAEGHQYQPEHRRTITPEEAMHRSTRFQIAPNHGTATGWHLPQPVADAMTPGTYGTLHVWCWSDQPERGVFLSWLFPRVLVRENTIDPEDQQVRVELGIQATGPLMLPYLAHLPADERPDYRSWNSATHTLVWPVDAVPAVTPTPRH